MSDINDTSGCPICGKPVKGIQGHIKTVHPEHYTPLKPGRKTKTAVEPLPVDDVIGVIIKAMYGDAIPVAHFAHVIKLRADVQLFMDAVSK